MSSTAVDSTLTATAVLMLGASLLLVAWMKRSARRRARSRIDPRAALAQAEALRQQGRVADARALLSQAALAHPNDSAIHYRLACCSSLVGDFRAALAALKRACDLDANWAVSAMHDPDLRALWQSGTPGTRASQWLAARDLGGRRAA